MSILATLCLSGLILSACGGEGGDTEKKGVLWYTGTNPVQNAATIQAFNKIHPDIKVTPFRLPSSQLAIRYGKERASGGKSADVLAIADPVLIAEGVKENWWDTSVKKPTAWPENEWNDGVAKIGVVAWALGYNTDRVTGDSIPSSWEDALAPEFKGKILFPDPRNTPSYMALMQIWSDEYGPDFLSKFIAQKPQLVDSVVPGNQSLGAGAGALMVPNAHQAAATIKESGGPVEVVDVSPTTGVETFAMVSDNASNPESARLFFEFLLTEEGQSKINGSTGSSVLGQVGDTTKLPEGYIALDDILPKAQANRAKLLAALQLN